MTATKVVTVNRAQIAAAKLRQELDRMSGQETDPAVDKIASARTVADQAPAADAVTADVSHDPFFENDAPRRGLPSVVAAEPEVAEPRSDLR